MKKLYLIIAMAFLILPLLAGSAMSLTTLNQPIGDAVNLYVSNNNDFTGQQDGNTIMSGVAIQNINLLNEKTYVVNNDTGNAKINPAVIGQIGLVALIEKAENQNLMGAPRKILTISAVDNNGTYNRSGQPIEVITYAVNANTGSWINLPAVVNQITLVSLSEESDFQNNMGAPRKMLITAANNVTGGFENENCLVQTDGSGVTDNTENVEMVNLLVLAGCQDNSSLGAPRKMLITADNNGTLSPFDENCFGQTDNAELINLVADIMNFQQGCRENMVLGAPRKMLTDASIPILSFNAGQYNQMNDIA